MTAQEKRLALNEALFRETNERVEERVRLFIGDEEQFGVICECASLDCKERITMSKDEYALVRSDPAQFVVKPGHLVQDVEEVVVRNDRFEIVRKRGVAAEVAEFLDEEDASEDLAPPA
jgi:predicted metal-binding transcription factor (methanogenesis marker protein 9)